MNMNTKSQCIINPDTKLLIRDAPLGISVIKCFNHKINGWSLVVDRYWFLFIYLLLMPLF